MLIHEGIIKFQAAADKANRALESEISDASQRSEDLANSLSDAEMNKKRLQTEKNDLEKQIEDGENTARALNKLKTSLATQVIKQ